MDNILEKINQASLKFLEPLSAESLFKNIVEEAIKLVDAEYGSILLEEKNEFKRIYASSPLAYKTVSRKNGNTYKSFTERKVIISNIGKIAKFHPELEENGIKSSIFIPLSYQGKAIGVLVVNSKHEIQQTAREFKVLTLFGSLATLAIKKTQLYDETKKALETRDLFISLASHELRTPLTSINGYIQLLHKKLSKQENSEGKWIRELSDECQRLTNLVKELLEINRIKQGQLQFNLRESNMHDIIDKAIGRLKFSYLNRDITFINNTTGKEDEIIGDSDKLLQMMSAFLSNAAKFSNNDTSITIELTTQKKYVVVTIADNGEGIDAQDLARIFEEFYKAPHNLKEGMGIGLMLAKHIINYHRGEVKVKSKRGKGTIIELKLPKINYA
ncbi:hypothetical protein BH11PAT1_BH11PAT1_2350 [soil metagenome]